MRKTLIVIAIPIALALTGCSNHHNYDEEVSLDIEEEMLSAKIMEQEWQNEFEKMGMPDMIKLRWKENFGGLTEHGIKLAIDFRARRAYSIMIEYLKEQGVYNKFAVNEKEYKEAILELLRNFTTQCGTK